MKQHQPRIRRTVVGLFLLGLAAASLGGGGVVPTERVVQYQYDAVDRLTSVTYDGEFFISYSYDAAGNILGVNVNIPQDLAPLPPGALPKPPVQSRTRALDSD